MSKEVKYKDTGIPYCPQIPESWNVKRLKFVGESIIGITYHPSQVTDEENGKLVLRSSNVQDGILSFKDNVYVNSDISEKYLSKEGDILICARNGSAHLVGKCAYIPKEYAGLTFGAFMLMFRSEYGKFMYYVFNSNLFKSQTGLFKTSTINQLTTDTINNLFVALPNNKEEQEKIASFLDEKTAQIDTIISKKQNLIACLKEERMAIINQAVTKGIDSNVEMKLTRIEWIGEIPKKWVLKKLKYLLEEIIDNRGRTPPYGSEGRPMLEVSQLTNESEIPLTNFTKFTPESELDKFIRCELKEGDILIATVGATAGKTAIVQANPKYFIAQNIVAFRANSLINSKFLYFILSSDYFQQSLGIINKSNTIDNLKVSIFLNNDCITPSLNEQKKITDYLEAQTEHIDKAISKIEQEIELIKEYRTSLINEVVTGKILLN